ncbi:FRG domain-containing protein [Aestuariibaculum sp. YM273]|uniref:FRG domain-containing protein n=1 Tax=Aestuariibaculum sp. YM273 TaxID=3070659 RepID=UPI0027DC776F|nr:FRG domain-containing protein [Aestuariibaculum sp. YM273]WMI64605.1 FRG domain-containing protein [Aestuariibaculum sp. YM273]
MYKELPIEMRLKFEPTINSNGKTIQGVSPVDKTTYWLYDFGEDCDCFFECFNNPFSELYQTDILNMPAKYVFRGHKFAEWDLLPSAFRDLNLEGNENELNVLKSGNGHVLPELKDFVNFIKGLNGLGYKIEEETFKLINSLEDENFISSRLIDDFPKESQLKELALAQHYGVPTRLLDFTFNPNVAMFFAGESVKHPKKGDDSKIGIWAIPERLIDLSREDFFIDRIFVQGYQNQNMIAQKGLFINYFYGRAIDDSLFDVSGKITSLDKYLYQNKRRADNQLLVDKKIGKPCLFSLSHKAVWQLFQRLENMDINWYTIQPDLEGIKKEVERMRVVRK